MFWSIVGIIGGGTFVVNGFGVLTDPNCDTVSFGGGRAVQVTCYQAGSAMTGAVSGTVAGLGMLVVGGGIIYFAIQGFRRR
jgi:hypothetical protein